MVALQPIGAAICLAPMHDKTATMKRMKISHYGLALLAPLLLAACAGSTIKWPIGGGATATGINSTGQFGNLFVSRPTIGYQSDAPTIYFEIDSSDVQPAFIPLIAEHSEQLAADSSKRALIEGHSDERGSREYNIALAERRALSVRRLLLGGGASDSQIRVLSYGEERPAMLGHQESAWAKNRRVEIHY